MPITQDRMIALLQEIHKVEEYSEELTTSITAWAGVALQAGKITPAVYEDLVRYIKLHSPPVLVQARVEYAHFKSFRKENDRRRERQERKRREFGTPPLAESQALQGAQLRGLESRRAPAHNAPSTANVATELARIAAIPPEQVYAQFQRGPSDIARQRPDLFDAAGNIRPDVDLKKLTEIQAPLVEDEPTPPPEELQAGLLADLGDTE